MHKIITIIACLLLAIHTTGADNKKFTLVIDAGHGGKDAGAKGRTALEKTINLKTALAFGKYVETNCPDVKVIYTRKTDVFVTLEGRAEIANKAKADLFISIHTNALPKGRIARGIETYTLGMHRAADNLEVAKRENSVILVEDNYKTRYQGFDPRSSESYIIFELMQDVNMERSVSLAKAVQTNLCRSTKRNNMGVKQAGFLVLRETSMPSCLIELGFISTPDEERLLADPTHQDKMARAIYNAFVEYRRTLNPSAPLTTISSDPTPRAADPTPASAEPTPKSATTAPEPAPSAPEQSQDRPTFKVQFLTSDSKLKAGDKRLKGITSYSYYEENRIYKYTTGASTDYNEIYRLRKTIVGKFPQAFIIAFRGNEKMDVQQAIQEFKKNKK